MSNPWPKHGPEFNRWNGSILRLAELLDNPGKEAWWCCDPQLKYLNIRIDTRDGGFVLYDRDGAKIDPERVEKAINTWRNEFGGAGRKVRGER